MMLMLILPTDGSVCSMLHVVACNCCCQAFLFFSFYCQFCYCYGSRHQHCYFISLSKISSYATLHFGKNVCLSIFSNHFSFPSSHVFSGSLDNYQCGSVCISNDQSAKKRWLEKKENKYIQLVKCVNNLLTLYFGWIIIIIIIIVGHVPWERNLSNDSCRIYHFDTFTALKYSSDFLFRTCYIHFSASFHRQHLQWNSIRFTRGVNYILSFSRKKQMFFRFF